MNVIDDPASVLSQCFCEKSPKRKIFLINSLNVNSEDLLNGLIKREADNVIFPRLNEVGVPDLPRLVPAKNLPKRTLMNMHGRGAFFHAICHIEFTAINLALDAALRFSGMPAQYYSDWLRIAQEEAAHFAMLSSHLGEIGFEYGDFDAHDGMWQLAERTAHDVVLRMALVPRVLEARGLDVTPSMIKRLELVDDINGAAILKRIYTDEIKHVEAGTRWFTYAARARGLQPEEAFHQAVTQEFGTLRTNKLNWEGRRLAGFTEAELLRLSEG